MWDEMVDVVAVGAGPGALACAVAAVDAGLDVFVARPGAVTPVDVSGPRGWLPVLDDPDSTAYFDALGEELPTVTLADDVAELQVRALQEVRVDTSRRAQVETFVGSRLGVWAATCIASPYGLLFTRVDHWPTSTKRTSGGKSLEVATLDETGPADRTFAERLDALVEDRGIEVVEDSPLQRFVFEEGEIAGVVVDSPDGPWAVQARVGIVVTSPNPAPADHRILAAGSRISLVGLKAGRFGRVEVLSATESQDG